MSSAIQIQCPSCGAKLRARESLVGKTVSCPKCKQSVSIPEVAPSPAAVEAIRPTSVNTIDGTLGYAIPTKRRRERPATDKQKEYATDLGIEFDDGISAKKISAMIDAA